MTPEQVKLVKETWSAVIPIQEKAAELFYGRLFSEYPEVKPLFKGDMQEQGEKLMNMLDQAVSALDNVESLIEPLKDAGKAHKEYGVSNADYPKVGACLLWTLEQGLGDAYNPAVEEAWAATYETVSSVMIEGANEVVVKPEPVKSKFSWFQNLFVSRA
ncbi:MAG: hypothetical protein KTR32_29030 [Granulosicoccus sp.]|nr:hypothetical protein [Granulosicoccus sp.]